MIRKILSLTCFAILCACGSAAAPDTDAGDAGSTVSEFCDAAPRCPNDIGSPEQHAHCETARQGACGAVIDVFEACLSANETCDAFGLTDPVSTYNATSTACRAVGEAASSCCDQHTDACPSGADPLHAP